MSTFNDAIVAMAQSNASSLTDEGLISAFRDAVSTHDHATSTASLNTWYRVANIFHNEITRRIEDTHREGLRLEWMADWEARDGGSESATAARYRTASTDRLARASILRAAIAHTGVAS